MMMAKVHPGLTTWMLLIVGPIATNSFHDPQCQNKVYSSSFRWSQRQLQKSTRYDRHHNRRIQLAQSSGDSGGDDDKFSFGQRIESIKTAVVGGLSGSVCVTPFTALHDLLLDGYKTNGVAQWEFDTDMAALQGALFAIVYRYCVRQSDNNPMLNQGVLGAFVLIRTLSRVRVPSYCSAIPLECGSPLGYLDWALLGQVAINGIESAVLFGAASSAIEYCFQRGFISKFK
jgi:hypothetical protein